jgi:Zn-dependent membrane protease YugP
VSAFVDSLGINVHMGYFNTPYGSSSSVITKLDYLGLHHVRDAAAWSGWVAPLARLGEAGIKLNVMLGGQGDTLNAQFSYLEKLAPYVATIEGPNEVNYWPVTYNGETGIRAAVQQQAYVGQRLETIASLKDKPLVGFSVAASSNSGFAPYGDNSAPSDYGNAHVYFPAGTAPGAHLQTYVTMANQLTPGDRMFLTETGFPTNGSGPGNQGVSETVQAKYTLDVVMDAYKQGVARTFLYELQDQFSDPGNTDQEKHYGLFRHDGSAKPAAVALHNLTTILADTAAGAATFKTGTLNYSVSGLPSSGNHMLMQEANGNFDIVVWNEPVIWNDAKNLDLNVAAQNVTVDLGSTFSTVNVYDPLLGAGPIKTYYNISSLSLSVTDHPLIVETVAGANTPAPAPAPAPAPVTGLMGTQTVGSGPDTLVLKLSEDAYRGDAQFTVRVDGKQVGGTMTAHAIKSAGQYENLEIKGDWAAGSHKVNVTFLNDAWGGSATTDRNLHVEGATFNGASVAGSVLGSVNGTESFSFTSDKPVVTGLVGTQTVGSGPDILVLKLSEDAYRGDAQFTVRVDGKQVGGTMTAHAIKSAGQYENLEIKGDWAAGSHKVNVTFLNDAWGGSATTDRNLHVEGATFNGASVAGSVLGSVNGTESFSFTEAGNALGSVNGTESSTPSEASQKLILHMSEDAWNGNAQFKVRVDGVQVGGTQTVTAIHSRGQVQEFAFDGKWSAGEHKIEVQFLNDAYGGTASADRNLYVEAIEVGSTYNDLDFAMKSNGTAHFDHILFA